MNIFIKRLLCFLLVISLMVTMTGCAEGIGTIFQLGQSLVSALGNLAIAGVVNTFLLVGLDSLKIVLDAYFVAAEEHQRQIGFAGLATGKNFSDGQFQNQWIDMYKPKSTWDERITFEHILGIEKVEGLKLPTLPEIVGEYPNLSEAGKLFADEYILFAMDEVFEETLGITYTDYVNFISEY